MRAIAGIFRKDGSPVEQKSIEDMLDKAASRGPDSSSILLERNVGFCHGLLITTPESIYESQPVTSSCKNYTITADARIDNRDELIDILDIDQKNQKKYCKPRIIHYGSVTDLTKGPGGSVADGASGRQGFGGPPDDKGGVEEEVNQLFFYLTN